MEWTVTNHEAFEPEYAALPTSVRLALLAELMLLRTYGPALARPHADTLTGSKYPNMKELRFNAEDGVWRVAFAFDPKRKGIILVAGDKTGVAQKRFYKALIGKADARFAEHLDALKGN
ncbi:type II toxin-antitoxin system RelE/ParE family toxin [Novosphingobium sp.]|uniref:type II toxin-antitoxin system RelE/ParE family toxin n=1 Tax=Novosphingobium sp. TaxID=1874826 RepID=UPI00334044EE